MPKALEIALAIRDEQGFGFRVEAMDALAPHLDTEALRAALAASTAIEDHVWQVRALGTLATSAPEQARPPIVREALAVTALVADPFDRADAIARLAPLLDDGTRERAVDMAVAFGLPELRALAMTAIAAARGAPRGIRPRALKEVLAIENYQSRAEALNTLALILADDEALLRRCLDAAFEFEKGRNAGIVLAAVVPHLRGPAFDRGVRAMRALHERGYWGIALSAIASQEGGRPLAHGLEELHAGRPPRRLLVAALDETDTHLNDEFRAFATSVLAPHLPADLLDRAVHVALGIRGNRRRDQVPAPIVRRMATGAIAALVNGERDDERRSRLLFALGPHAGGVILDEAFRRALALPDARDRLEAVAPLGRLASDLDVVRRALRRAAADYLLSRKDGIRVDTLWLCGQAQICTAPVFSADTLADVTEHVLDICRHWSWSPTAVPVSAPEWNHV